MYIDDLWVIEILEVNTFIVILILYILDSIIFNIYSSSYVPASKVLKHSIISFRALNALSYISAKLQMTQIFSQPHILNLS